METYVIDLTKILAGPPIPADEAIRLLHEAAAEIDALESILHGVLNGDPDAQAEARELLYGPEGNGKARHE